MVTLSPKPQTAHMQSALLRDEKESCGTHKRTAVIKCGSTQLNPLLSPSVED